MRNIFLNNKHRENIKQWKYSVIDNSITTKIFTPLWNHLVTLVPRTVAPNILTLVGLFCNIYAYYITVYYIQDYPQTISLLAGLLNFIYMHLDAIDGKHARKIRNSSPLGELFDHSCDNIGIIFMMLTLCNIVGLTDHVIQWYIVQIAQLVFLHSHIDAFKEKIVSFGLLTGPGEVLMVYFTIILFKGLNLLGCSFLLNYFTSVSSLFGYDTIEFGKMIIMLGYYTVLLKVLHQVFKLKDHYETRNGLFISLGLRFVPSILIYLNLMSDELSTYTVISHGVIMAVLTGDMIVSKMAQRELHPLVPIFVMTSLLNSFFCISATIFYYVCILTEIAHHLKLPLLDVVENGYCNGAFDVTVHNNHIRLFRIVAKRGKVLVGVHNDKDIESYKRKPILDEKTRYENVTNAKYVDNIITDAPLITTKEFIEKHNITTVYCSSEYDSPEDIYYKDPREMGILVVVQRGKGTSTSGIIKKIRDRKVIKNKQKDKQN